MSDGPTSDEIIEVSDAPSVPGLAFRRYRGEEDLVGFKAVFDDVKEADGLIWNASLEDLRTEFRHLDNCDPDKDIVVVEHDGRIIGFSTLKWLPELDGSIMYRQEAYLVHEWRGRGIGRAVLRYIEARAKELMAGHPGDGNRFLTTWLSETERYRPVQLEAEGYSTLRDFRIMLRDLREPIPDLSIPEGLEVRPVPPEDYRKVFEAANEALKDHWGGREWTEGEYRKMVEGPSFDPGLWQIAYDGDEVAGNVLNYIDQAANEEFDRKWGWTEFISVRRPYRGKGLATALIARSMMLLRDLGLEYAALGVDMENISGALGLYEALGYRTFETHSIVHKDLR